LLGIMLEDSARIQEEEAAHFNIRHHYREPLLEPLYTQTDADYTIDLAVALSCRSRREILPGVVLTLHEAGHILGSAMVHLGFASGGSLTFTGDLGRRGMPILRPADPIPPADVVICESTYGTTAHIPLEETVAQLTETVKRTLARGGKVLIPAFSLGRTQLVVHHLCDAMRSGTLPRMQIYVDSPLAADIATVYQQHPECLQENLAPSHDFLGSSMVRYVRDFQESMRLSVNPEARIIVAASGMCEAGRIVQHLQHHIDDPRSTVILVSFQAAGTPGRKMLEKGPTVRFLGKEWNKWAEIVHLEGFSGHADQPDFLAYFEPLLGRVEEICLVHGERERGEGLASALTEHGFTNVSLPGIGDRVEVG
jgi:metallo-beta-lactamase family protein